MAIWASRRATNNLSLWALFALLSACVTPGTTLDENDWLHYQQRFISPEGRVLDTGNGNVSHSEGQGFGMLLAVAYDDQQTFRRLWSWTAKNLQVRNDKLFAWRWSPSETGGAVHDSNNATDGDLLLAWALCRAGERWAEPSYREAAAAISQDIRHKLLRHDAQAVYLLPGAVGFEKPTGTIVNLSYWIFPAFIELAQLDPAPIWEQLSQTGLMLLQTARFGRWQLPPDWLTLHDPLTVARDFPPHFGYNAIRIPLYLIWAKREDHRILQPYLDFWAYFDGSSFTPAWTNLLDDSVDSYNAPVGVRAIIQAVRTVAKHPTASPLQLPLLDGEQDYYSASLLLLTKLALAERH